LDLRNNITRSGRPPNLARKDVLRDAALELLLDRGLFGVSLEELAASTGASSRMLIHYFGSKDGLLTAAITEARRQQLTAAREHLARAEIHDVSELLEAMWSFIESPSTRRHLRLFAEVAALSAQDPVRFPGFSEASVRDWLPDLEETLQAAGYEPATAETLATLAFAVERGLLLDRNATGDTERIDAAHTELVAALRRHR
jgi:AcrR family transcriptional regulator